MAEDHSRKIFMNLVNNYDADQRAGSFTTPTTKGTKTPSVGSKTST
jgi:hypothetical protein